MLSFLELPITCVCVCCGSGISVVLMMMYRDVRNVEKFAAVCVKSGIQTRVGMYDRCNHAAVLIGSCVDGVVLKS